MGNIVSNAVVPGQVSSSPSGVRPATPMSGVAPVIENSSQGTSSAPTAPSTDTIEGMDETQSGYNVDPFGPIASASTTSTLPDLSNEPPSITPEPPPAPPTPQPFSPPVPEKTAEGTHASAAELLSRMPDITQMMKDLEKSGCLLPELQIKNTTAHMDTSPLAALQPNQKEQEFFSTPSDQATMKVLPEVQLASSSVAQKGPKPELPLFVFIGIIALVEGVQGTAQALHFLLVRYPSYEQMIIANVMTTTEVNAAVIKGIILAIFAVIGLLVGLLVILKRSKNQSPLTYFAVVLIVMNFVIQNFMATKIFASGSPMVLPEIIADILARPKY